MNNPSVFRHDQLDLRAGIDEQGEPWFAAADVARFLGHRDAANLVRSLDPDEKGTHQTSTPGGSQLITTITEAGFYQAIMQRQTGRMDEVQAAAIKRFQRWVTHDVLPSIRRTGSYAAPVQSDDEIVARALQITAARVQALEAKVAEDAPKVLFADSVATSQTTILVGDLAKILKGNGLDIGGTRLFELLRNDGYLIKRQGTDRNMPTQKAMELGLFKVKETAVTHSDGHVTISKTPKVTGKGQAYFVNRYSALRAVA
ncbi:phage antirepressor Ant [Curtobacterium sp. 'Ferrero']|uniref:phage antirepressor KilAC domain-containing protein n=1 Tax=Curtobacterium sp. 'Ferrero' TaxID=2033654 RepID=UPI000BDCAD22|nr:phage antirepressor KilAC domain-containing protein [Curtobacterium sp. 'Ferrero']PCN47999.1 phage antirepressor Ant [Curtobacterium sp. 'Ferrero']